jgi:tetratricopeptide (TPR) repeat protein
MMKKNLLLVVVITFITIATQAQNPVLNLSNYLRNGMLDKAHENLNLAMGDDRYTSDAKTWLLRGNLYYATFRCYDFVNGIRIGMPADSVRYLKGDPLTDFKKQKTPDGKANKWEWDLGFSVLVLANKVYSFTEPVNGSYKAIVETPEKALELAKESYIKTIELDPRFMGDMTFPTNAYQGLSIISEGYTNNGVMAFNAADYKTAYINFSAAHELKKALGIREPRDTIPGYYAVRAASVYVRELSEKGNYEEAIEVATKARIISPDDVDLSLSEADTYLKMKDFLKTKALLEEIVVKQPDNAQLYFVIGNIYDELSKDTTKTAEEITENFDLTVQYYKKAIEIKPDYFEALFNLGTIYNNKAVDLVNIANKLPFGDARYGGLMKQADELFNIALPYLEKAHEVNGADADPIRMLQQLYLRQKKNDQAAEMKKRLDALKNKE